MPWYQSTIALLAAIVIFPPAGLILLWIRSRPKVAWKILASIAIMAVGVVHLFAFYGMRMEMDGSGLPGFFTFRTPEDRAQAIEENRSEPAPAPVVVEAAPPPVTTTSSTARNYWTDYRGPGRLGIYNETPILTKWPAGGLKPLWKQPVGGGYASFAIADGMLFTIEQRRDSEFAAAYDAATGRERWTSNWKARFQESLGGEGPRTTPVYDEGRVYVLGAEGEFRCLEAATGRVIWRKNILADNGASNLMWAQSASPLIVDNKVIVLPGAGGGKSVVAYDKLTGNRIWSALDDEQSYTSPMLVTLGGKRQLLVVTATRAVGLTVDDGKLLWEFPWVTEYHINASQPIVTAPNRFLISAGYGHGSALVEIQPSGAKAIWENNRMKAKFNSPVLHERHVYGLDEGILQCIDATTGEQKWKGGRYGYGQVLLASGHLIVIGERGELALVKASPAKHEEVAQFQAIEGKTWNNPAIAGGILYVRNTTEMAAFSLKP
jgi:outer membrane protein assembly factor BamB